MSKADEKYAAVKRLMPWIWRLEAFLIVFYSLAIWCSQYFICEIGRLPLVCILAFVFGLYFTLRGIGVFGALREGISFRFSHPLTTPASLCALPALLVVAVANNLGMGSFVILSAICAAAGPLALLTYGVFVVNPVRLSNIYSDLIARGARTPRKKP